MSGIFLVAVMAGLMSAAGPAQASAALSAFGVDALLALDADCVLFAGLIAVLAANMTPTGFLRGGDVHRRIWQGVHVCFDGEAAGRLVRDSLQYQFQNEYQSDSA